MGSEHTVSINGRKYDPRTGLPMETVPAETIAPVTAQKTTVHSTAVHASQQKSTTLNRRVAKKKMAAKPANARRSMDITSPHVRRHTVQQSPAISRFAKHPAVKQATQDSDIQPTAHPIVQKAHAAQAHRTVATAPIQPTKKDEVVAKALANSVPAKTKKVSLKKRFPRLVSIGSASLAVLLIAGYLTYLNMPTISIRVAAAQSGINASYPGYHPTGYRLTGPIAWNDGNVSMRFAANAGPQNFTINEQKSSWDSSAVLENYIQPKVGSNYVPQTQNGLTVYTYDNNAAWVNGGILYTIEGDAPLSNDQILHIATSL